jgi:hypothetical protein
MVNIWLIYGECMVMVNSLPSGNDCYIAIENGPVEIVDLSIN